MPAFPHSRIVRIIAALLILTSLAACIPVVHLENSTSTPIIFQAPDLPSNNSVSPQVTPFIRTTRPVKNTPTPTRPTDILIQAYFTDGEGAANENGPLEQAILADIEAARTGIDIAMYNFSLRRLADALIAAKGRGVQVRFVTDSDALDGGQIIRLQKSGIPMLGDRHQSLMHNKFMVIDNEIVWTGSLNLTGTGTYQDDNNFVRFRSKPLAVNYTMEFEEMFVKDLFSVDRRKANTPNPNLKIGSARVENYFSPEDRPSRFLVPLLRDAQSSIDFLVYSFTQDGLADALLTRDKAGVTVRGVFEDQQYQSNQGGEFLRLKRGGVDVHLDGNPGLMHHKVFIVDGHIVIFGSYNFTSSADSKNDENVIVVDDPNLAAQFENEFERIYAEAQP